MTCWAVPVSVVSVNYKHRQDDVELTGGLQCWAVTLSRLPRGLPRVCAPGAWLSGSIVGDHWRGPQGCCQAPHIPRTSPKLDALAQSDSTAKTRNADESNLSARPQSRVSTDCVLSQVSWFPRGRGPVNVTAPSRDRTDGRLRIFLILTGVTARRPLSQVSQSAVLGLVVVQDAKSGRLG